MIVSRVETGPDDFGDRVGYLAARAAAVVLPAPAARDSVQLVVP